MHTPSALHEVLDSGSPDAAATCSRQQDEVHPTHLLAIGMHLSQAHRVRTRENQEALDLRQPATEVLLPDHLVRSTTRASPPCERCVIEEPPEDVEVLGGRGSKRHVVIAVHESQFATGSPAIGHNYHPWMTLQLRAPRPADEAALRRLHAQFQQEDFDFLLAAGEDWDAVLDEIDREALGVDLRPGRVRAEFLVAEMDGVIVGRTSIRYALTDVLREVGGHVGYAVAPEFRRRGYATEILRLSVERLAGAGVDRVLVTCDDTNLGSIRTIERCGGVLEDVRDVGGSVPKRRYWIEAAGAGQSLN